MLGSERRKIDSPLLLENPEYLNRDEAQRLIKDVAGLTKLT